MINKSNEPNQIDALPRLPEGEYGGLLVEPLQKADTWEFPEPANVLTGVEGKSVGKGDGSVVGCNANNGNASARTSNCNNRADNSNDNYAGAFAINNGTLIGKLLATRASSTKITDKHTATGGYAQCDYESLPYWSDNAESNAIATNREQNSSKIWGELEQANKKRKLKNLKRFFLNREIVAAGFDRCMKNASPSAEIEWYKSHKGETINRIINELAKEEYIGSDLIHRAIKKRNKTDKQRYADIYIVYDRIIQNVILIIIEIKFRNMFIRNIYSGIKGRSLLSNDKRYCMINIIRGWVKAHPYKWVGLTDISKFYESLGIEVAMGVMFKTIVCPFTRRLLVSAFIKTDTVPIGGPMSQMMAMVTLLECDRMILERWNVFLCCFGDNRLVGGSKKDIQDIISFQKSYYAGRYNLELKGDYSIRKVRDGFRFCKYDYKDSFVHVRSEIRRRAIKSYKKGQQHYAGHKGLLLKTDSKHLRYLIENKNMELRNSRGMKVPDMMGDKRKFHNFPDDTEIWIISFRRQNTDKESGYFYWVQFITIDKDGKKHLYKSSEGSEEIKGFFHLVEKGVETLPKKVKIRKDGTRCYFEGYHTSNEEACNLICEQFGIE